MFLSLPTDSSFVSVICLSTYRDMEHCCYCCYPVLLLPRPAAATQKVPCEVDAHRTAGSVGKKDQAGYQLDTSIKYLLQYMYILV